MYPPDVAGPPTPTIPGLWPLWLRADGTWSPTTAGRPQVPHPWFTLTHDCTLGFPGGKLSPPLVLHTVCYGASHTFPSPTI